MKKFVIGCSCTSPSVHTTTTLNEAQFSAMTDSQLLQIAANGLRNEGKPTPDLATDSTAVWKVDGNTVSVTRKSYAAPNPAYPAITDLNVNYKAVYINGKWY